VGGEKKRSKPVQKHQGVTGEAPQKNGAVGPFLNGSVRGRQRKPIKRGPKKKRREKTENMKSEKNKKRDVPLKRCSTHNREGAGFIQEES